VSRRLVVVLFLDLVGWTRLAERVDPEPLQLLLEQYYEICSSVVDQHGGAVEKFIGDAVMAVFGATRSQEDDVLRALRAACQIRAEVGELHGSGGAVPELAVHCGIAAGEALVTHSSLAGLRVVGDVVNLAARLQSMAAAGEILVNKTVADLALANFTMIPVPPLTLKGKSGLVEAFMVAGPAAVGRADDRSDLVNRTAERHRLCEAYRGVILDRRARIVTVRGPSGIGKTRLVREAMRDAGADAVFGSCPSYGPDGQYAALVQVLAALAERAASSADLRRADDRIAAVLDSLGRASPADRGHPGPGPGVEEVSWAVRELFAAAASARPLVVVWDGLQWATPTLLQLIGELAESLRHLPLLMICAARPDLAEPDVPWLRGSGRGDVIDLGGLSPAESAELAALLMGTAGAPASSGAVTDGAEVQAHSSDVDLIDRVAVYSAGNPMFIRLVLESVTPGRLLDEVPPTITAVVGAMIDRLPEPAQRVLGAASVIGSVFTLEQLAFLGEPPPAEGIDVLVERRFIHAAGEAGGYGFIQQPVHEVAYGRLDKQRRYAWHRRLAEYAVSSAFHLEAAVRLLSDLRPKDPELEPLARQAAAALLLEGTEALRQRDIPTAVGLLDRAVSLMPGDDQRRAAAVIRLSDALMLVGDTRHAVDSVTEVARQCTNDRVPRACLVQLQIIAARLGGTAAVDTGDLLARVEEDRADRLAWCRFEQLRMLLYLDDGRFGAAEGAVLSALEHARALGDEYEEDRLLAALCEVRQWSPTPIAEKLASCAELTERFAADRVLLVPVLVARARCLTLTGDQAGARASLAQAAAAVEQLRLTMGQILVDQATGLACSLDGDHEEAERRFRVAAAALERAGHVPVALTLRVQATRERARQVPAGTAAAEIAELLDRRAEMDSRGRLLCTSAAVRLDGGTAALRGEVLSLLERTDDPCLRGEAYFDLAQAHRQLGDHDGARDMARAAINSYATVGATQPMRLVRSWI
jgi:class 3 adenylate cyclase/tetratricopeptide (TPR) repeat protein